MDNISRNPAKLPLPLLPAEERLVQYLQAGERKGKDCVVGSGRRPERIEYDGEGLMVNVVRAEVIRFFAYGGDEEKHPEYPILGQFIRLQGAWIEGALDLTHAVIPYALTFHRCHFDSRVTLRHTECAELDLRGSSLAQGLRANPLWTKGGVLLKKGFISEGVVDISSSRIGGALDCSKGEFRKGLVANKAKMGVLVWDKVEGGDEREDTTIELKAAQADVLDDNADAWKPFKVNLDGFTYNQFARPTGSGVLASRMEWLDKRPDGVPFSPQPYEQMASALFGMGYANGARKVLLEKERQQTWDERGSWYRKFWRVLWDVLAGYGYRSRYAMGWMVFIVLAGALFFGCAAEQDKIVPHQPAVLASAAYQGKLSSEMPMKAARQTFPEYPEFSPLAFSLDVFIPLFALHQEPFWAPAPGEGGLWKSSLLLALLLTVLSALVILTLFFRNLPQKSKVALGSIRTALGKAIMLLLGVGLVAIFVCACLGFDLIRWLIDWRWLIVWYWIEIAAGWILTSLFLLSLAGLLRPRQSSSAKN